MVAPTTEIAETSVFSPDYRTFDRTVFVAQVGRFG